ncbi:PA14 domain-containing protein [Streptomyces sp. SID12501]|uniref:PA14 domain-containing protein n=1 Tax=Streptomyces sp. SID12501 TaxID=2706042 RepID=UPI00194442D8
MISATRTTVTGAVTSTAATAVVLATAGGLLTAVAAAAPASAATVTCASPAYKRQFFANTTFSGTLKKTDCDTTIAENWGAKAPATGLPKDNFGVRWTVTRDFGSGGPFALSAATQDGIRVYLDGKLKIDLWKNVSATRTKTVNPTVPSGTHTLRIDYANFTGNANVNFAYTPRTSVTVDKVKPLATTTSTAATTYTDSTVPKTGETYAYEVRARDKAGNQSTGRRPRPTWSATRCGRRRPAGPTPTARPSPSAPPSTTNWQRPASRSPTRSRRSTRTGTSPRCRTR